MSRSPGLSGTYGKAGWGFADVDARFVDNDPTGGDILVSGTRKNATLTGAVFGGGIEFAVTDSATFKVEYLRLDIGDTLTHTAVDDFGGPVRFGHEIDAIDTVKVGFNIKLNREAPPPPPLK